MINRLSKRILIVEDDIHISNIIKMNLNLVNYETTQIYDGLAALEAIQNSMIQVNGSSAAPFDLIILDVMIPGMDGFQLMERIRPLGIPVIFLTAKTTVFDKVNGLKLGAEDYMVKPFEAIELLARIETVMRRYGKEEQAIHYKGVDVYLDKREVTVYGEKAELTPKEFDLLVVLLKNKNIALSREQILEKVWGFDFYGETRTIDTHVKELRKKLRLQDSIRTVYKIGYRLED